MQKEVAKAEEGRVERAATKVGEKGKKKVERQRVV
jgi:hypothetical protein